MLLFYSLHQDWNWSLKIFWDSWLRTSCLWRPRTHILVRITWIHANLKAQCLNKHIFTLYSWKFCYCLTFEQLPKGDSVIDIYTGLHSYCQKEREVLEGWKLVLVQIFFCITSHTSLELSNCKRAGICGEHKFIPLSANVLTTWVYKFLKWLWKLLKKLSRGVDTNSLGLEQKLRWRVMVRISKDMLFIKIMKKCFHDVSLLLKAETFPNISSII